MRMIKTVILIGNRPKVFEEIIKFKDLNCTHIFAVKNSLLAKNIENTNYEYTLFSRKDKKTIIEEIVKKKFDIIVSCGCPFILPISKIREHHQIFINMHPSFLPDLRGLHPINGAMLLKRNFTGATMHYMDDIIDNGNIIYQEKIEITDDIDLGIFYKMLFDLEARVFKIGMKKIIESNYKYEGKSQNGTISYYSRSKDDMTVDFESMLNEEILAKIRAFGTKSMGVSCAIKGESFKIFDAQAIFNHHILEKYRCFPCGEILVEYDDKFLIKTIDGVIKVNSYQAQ